MFTAQSHSRSHPQVSAVCSPKCQLFIIPNISISCSQPQVWVVFSPKSHSFTTSSISCSEPNVSHIAKPVYKFLSSVQSLFLRFWTKFCMNIHKKIVFLSFIGLLLVGSNMFSHVTFRLELLATNITMEASYMWFSMWIRHLRQGIVKCVDRRWKQNIKQENIKKNHLIFL